MKKIIASVCLASLFTSYAMAADTTKPVLTTVKVVPAISNDTTPSYTFSTTEGGTIIYAGACSSLTTTVASPVAPATKVNKVITFKALAAGKYSNCTIKVKDKAGNISLANTVNAFTIDVKKPVLTQIKAIPVKTDDSTPNYTFSSTEAGTLVYTGTCSSATTVVAAPVKPATTVTKSITLKKLALGTYKSCGIQLKDGAGNLSAVLVIPTFTIQATSTGGVVGKQMGGARQGVEIKLTTAVLPPPYPNYTYYSTFSTFAGSGLIEYANGTGILASFRNPEGITTDGVNLYVSEATAIRKIAIATGVVTTLAGSNASGYADGTGAAASFSNPQGITTDGTNLYVADQAGFKIRKVVIATGETTTVALNGVDTSLPSPKGITTDGTHLFITDNMGSTVKKIVLATGAISILAGNSSGIGTMEGTGTGVAFKNLGDITTDGTNLYVTQGIMNHIISKIVIATGVVTTFAGGSVAGSENGIGTAASFSQPYGITCDGKNLYVTDRANSDIIIRKIVIATRAVSGAMELTPDFQSVFSLAARLTTDGKSLYVVNTNFYSSGTPKIIKMN